MRETCCLFYTRKELNTLAHSMRILEESYAWQVYAMLSFLTHLLPVL